MPTPKVTISSHSGADYEYDYVLLGKLPEPTIADYCSSLRQRFSKDRANVEVEEQWVVRTYVALKYLLAASVMLSSADYAYSRNLRIAVPYLLYYTLLNTSRSLLLMIPEQKWDDGGLLDDPTHSKTRRVVQDYLRHLSEEYATRYGKLFGRAQAVRELLSYKFPAEGLRGELKPEVPTVEEVSESCLFIAEVAQMHSECLQSAYQKAPGVRHAQVTEALARIFLYEHEGLGKVILDEEDYSRMGQFLRNSPHPLSLQLTARPGLVDDFIGAWCPDEEDKLAPDHYNPDKSDMRRIFDFP